MNLTLTAKEQYIEANIQVSGSKSESNRLLILQQYYKNLIIKNLSDSDDTKVMQKSLSTALNITDVHHAGTAMRFLTAFFASDSGRKTSITGSERMQQRPIKILVDALQSLGANIQYENKEGYPPLKIEGKKLTNGKVSIQGNVSSQYISGLMLIAPSLPNGLEIVLLNEVTSVPYIKMTLALLQKIGVEADFKENKITIKHQPKIKDQTLTVESDWSSASYWYSLVALAKTGSKVTLSAYKKDSLQGDSCLMEIYKEFGVKTTFLSNKIVLEKEKEVNTQLLTLNLKNAPDIAQTIAVTCFGLGIACNLLGLHTLKIKETDRLVALKNELEKLGANITITEESLHLKAHSLYFEENWAKDKGIKTYNDHRMAMAFAPLALKFPITILNAEVVSKSYINFWKDFEKAGIISK